MMSRIRAAAAVGVGTIAVVIGLCGCSASGTPTPAGSGTPSTPPSATGPVPSSTAPSTTAPASSTAGCPARPLSIAASTASQVGVLLAFEPTSALVCRYSGMPDSGSLLGSARVTSTGELTQLRQQVDVLTRVRAGQVYHCPADTGGVIDVSFRDPADHLVVQFDQTGCQFVTSSDGSYRLPASSTLLADLKSLTS